MEKFENGISACIIAKDEESTLQNCLNSISDYADEIILVDTGSQDRTKEIAGKFTDKIYDFKWIDDFSAARNFGIEQCNYSHILIIDSDEILINPELLSEYSKKSNNTGAYLIEIISASMNEDKQEQFTSKIPRLIQNHPKIRFEARIHEQISYSVERERLEISNSDLIILHTGYSNPETLKNKHDRNLRLINIVLNTEPDNDYLYFQRAKTYLALNQFEEAEKDFKKTLALAPKSGTVYPQTLNYYAITALRMRKYHLAKEKAQESLKLNPEQSFANSIIGELLLSKQKYAEAYEYFRSMEKAQNKISLKSQLIGDYILPVEQLKFRLGKCLLNINLLDEAIEEFEVGLRHNPQEVSNYVGLANIAFKKNNYKLALDFLKQANNISPNNKEIEKFIQQVYNKIYKKKVDTIKVEDTSMPFISLSMIVKNEEQYLEECLKSIKDYVDEIVIVDTGSEDGTIKIAEKYGAKVYKTDWKNDFATARNESLKHCNGEWFIYLDADERLKQGHGEVLIETLKKSPEDIGAYVVTIESEHLQLDDSTEMHRGGYPRIIRNYGYPTIQFKGRVHEQITPSLFALNKKIDFTNIIFEHEGYNRSRDEMDKKVRRNYNLLIQHVKEEPLNGYAWYQLGQTLAQLHLFKEAENAIRMSIETGKLSDSVFASATATLSQIVGTKKNYEEALFWAEKSLLAAPEQVYALHLKAYAQLYLNRLQESEKDFLEVVKRLKNLDGVPRSGFDIVIPMEIVEKGLNEVRKRLET